MGSKSARQTNLERTLVSQKVSVRGKGDIEIFISAARLYVPSHNTKRNGPLIFKQVLKK